MTNRTNKNKKYKKSHQNGLGLKIIVKWFYLQCLPKIYIILNNLESNSINKSLALQFANPIYLYDLKYTLKNDFHAYCYSWCSWVCSTVDTRY